MRRAQSALHPQEFFLSRGKQSEPFRRKTVVRIVLEKQHLLAVVAEEGMAVSVAAVTAASMPTLPVKNQVM